MSSIVISTFRASAASWKTGSVAKAPSDVRRASASSSADPESRLSAVLEA
jgi:hypothetical protein